MEFEWDEAKHRANLRRREVGFDYAARIFEGPVRQWVDDRRDYGEERIIAVGRAGKDWITVVYTMRGEICRIISARRASRRERRP